MVGVAPSPVSPDGFLLSAIRNLRTSEPSRGVRPEVAFLRRNAPPAYIHEPMREAAAAILAIWTLCAADSGEPPTTTVRDAGTAPASDPPATPSLAETLSSWRALLGREAPPASSGGVVLLDSAPPAAAGGLASEISRQREAMRRHLGIPPEELRPLVILLHATPAEFAAAEERLFGSPPPPQVAARYHSPPPAAAISAWRDPDESTLRPLLARLVAWSLLDRPEDPAPLPAWVREGLSSHLAALAVPRGSLESRQRRAGLALIREGGDLGAVMNLPRDAEAWRAVDGPAAGASLLLVAWIAEQRPRAFAPFMERLRGGASVEDALSKALATTPSGLAAAVRRHHLVND
jgi:hypothetical protein